MSTTTEMGRYQVTGPRGEGPYVVEATSGLQAAAQVNAAFAMKARRGSYALEQPRGPHGPVVGYEPVGRTNPGTVAKVAAFDITWLPPAAWEDYPLTALA